MAFDHAGGGAATIFLCDLWLKENSYCPKVFCLARLPLSWLQEQVSVGEITDFFSSKSGIYEVEHNKTKQGSYHCVLRSLASIFLFQILMFVLYKMSRTFSCT